MLTDAEWLTLRMKFEGERPPLLRLTTGGPEPMRERAVDENPNPD